VILLGDARTRSGARAVREQPSRTQRDMLVCSSCVASLVIERFKDHNRRAQVAPQCGEASESGLPVYHREMRGLQIMPVRAQDAGGLADFGRDQPHALLWQSAHVNLKVHQCRGRELRDDLTRELAKGRPLQFGTTKHNCPQLSVPRAAADELLDALTDLGTKPLTARHDCGAFSGGETRPIPNGQSQRVTTPSTWRQNASRTTTREPPRRSIAESHGEPNPGHARRCWTVRRDLTS
jgi:hypothetical protein